jgi:hypothetical protein
VLIPVAAAVVLFLCAAVALASLFVAANR